MQSQKQLAEGREQIKRQIMDLDHQIHELETFYLEDTKEAGNLLRGFDIYVSIKTSKIQAGSKKQKVENYERLFSLSSITSKTSQVFEESILTDPNVRAEVQNMGSKRSRPRTGKPKSGGKTLMRDDNEDNDDDNDDSADNEDSLDESVSKNKGGSKKKKINKLQIRKA